MKKLIVFKYAFAASVAFGLLACEADLEDPVPSRISTIQFDSENMVIGEKDTEKLISLKLDRPAISDGLLSLELDTINTRLKIDHAHFGKKLEFNIKKGQEKIHFNIVPNDNTISDGNMNFNLTLSSVSSGFAIGGKKKLTIALLDDDQAQQPVQSSVDFTDASSATKESVTAHDIVIGFSRPLTATGSFEIQFSSAAAIYNQHYRSEPAAVNGKVLITPAVGATSALLRIIPIDNSIISSSVKLTLTIGNMTGAVIGGEQLTHNVEIADDELTGKPKGYAIGGNLSQSKTFTYDATGRVATVFVKSGVSERTETYYYDESGRIKRINMHPEMNTVFTWTGDRIIKSERIEYGVVKKYTEYDYDVQGNVSGTANYFLQPNGELKLSFIIVYLYYTDNNLYKTMHYLPGEGDEMTLLSTRTYENYQEAENPFPMVDILPTVKTQTKLPGSYRLEENGFDLRYTIDYQFSEQGRVIKRFARNGNQVETTEYYYY